MMGRQSGLGRGLGAIIPPKPATSSAPVHTASEMEVPLAAPMTVLPNDGSLELREIPLELIDPNPHQPREHFDHTGIEELVSSIREHGVMQPLVVTESASGRYELIAGERRLRASKIAGLSTVPAVVRRASELQKLELAIIENIQRQDLNPLEEARAYLRLQDEFSLTQEEIAKKVGKSRSQIANTIRLLQLPQEIRDALAENKISSSNARTLLSLPSDGERMELFRAMLAGHFTVRQTEARVPHPRQSRGVSDPNVAAVEQELRELFHTRVVVSRNARGAGDIRIAFSNDEDFQAIIKTIKRNVS